MGMLQFCNNRKISNSVFLNPDIAIWCPYVVRIWKNGSLRLFTYTDMRKVLRRTGIAWTFYPDTDMRIRILIQRRGITTKCWAPVCCSQLNAYNLIRYPLRNKTIILKLKEIFKYAYPIMTKPNNLFTTDKISM